MTNVEDDLTEIKTEIEFSATRIESTTMDVTYQIMYLSTIIYKGKTNRKFVKISLKLQLIRWFNFSKMSRQNVDEIEENIVKYLWEGVISMEKPLTNAIMIFSVFTVITC